MSNIQSLNKTRIWLSQRALQLPVKTLRQIIECVILAQHGFQLDTISRATRMTRGAVTYRLRQAGISVKTYRIAGNATSHRVIRGCKGSAHTIATRFTPTHLLQVLNER